MHYHLSDFALWFVTPILQAAVLMAMFRRHLSRSYRYFLAYTVLQVASVPMLGVVMYYSYTTYYYAYYVNLGLDVLVSYAVIWEILKTVFRWNRDRQRWGVIPLLCGAVLLVAAIEMVLTAQPSGAHEPVTRLMMLGDRSVRVAQLGIALGALFFANRLGVSRRSFLYGVIIGFGVFTATNLAIATRLSHHGAITSPVLSRINSIAYLIATLIWLFYAIYGTMDVSGFARSRFYFSPNDNDRRGPNRPNRWFFRLGSSQSQAAAGN